MKIYPMTFRTTDEAQAANMAEGFAKILSIDGSSWIGELTGERTPEGWYVAHIKEGDPNDTETKAVC